MQNKKLALTANTLSGILILSSIVAFIVAITGIDFNTLKMSDASAIQVINTFCTFLLGISLILYLKQKKVAMTIISCFVLVIIGIILSNLGIRITIRVMVDQKLALLYSIALFLTSFALISFSLSNLKVRFVFGRIFALLIVILGAIILLGQWEQFSNQDNWFSSQDFVGFISGGALLLIGTNMFILLRIIDKRKSLFHKLKEKMEAKTIAELKRLNIELISARQEADKANVTKNAFLSNISHELRTPLNGVIGLTNLLLETDLDYKQKEYVLLLRESEKQLDSIISDLLDYTNLEAKKLSLSFSPHKLSEIIQEVLDIVIPLLDQNDNHLSYFGKDNIDEYVFVDDIRLKQILINLLTNATKFTTKGQINLHTSVTEKDEIEAIFRFEVKDTGIGIPEEKRQQLFQKFYQYDTSNTRTRGGTGLGLSISKEIVSLFNGKIGCNSNEGKGSIFWFEIPLKYADKVENTIF